MSEEPHLYSQTCKGLPRKFDSRIRKDSTHLQQEGTKHVIFFISFKLKAVLIKAPSDS